MKYGNFLCLLTTSQALLMEPVKGPGPQLNTPTLLTYKKNIRKFYVQHFQAHFFENCKEDKTL
jgi:hypothetical protein